MVRDNGNQDVRGVDGHALAEIFFAGLFALSAFSMGMAIERQKADIRARGLRTP